MKNATILKLLNAAKLGNLQKFPELLTFENLTSYAERGRYRGPKLCPLEVAARHGYLDQIPQAILDKLPPAFLARLRRDDELSFRKALKVAKKVEGVPF